jgi:anti-sigma factor RsiW
MQHLDDGTIHAWLDGQLPRDEAQAVEAHVAECRQCAGAVAEARGLIAASSRILTALDGVPRDVVPKQPLSGIDSNPREPAAATLPAAPVQSRAEQRARRRWFNGASLAAAATIVVAVGTVTLMRAGSRDARVNDAARLTSVTVTPPAGPSVDSLAVPSATTPPAQREAASVPAAPPPAVPAPKPLGDVAASSAKRFASVEGQAAGVRQEAVPAQMAPPARVPSNERPAEVRRDAVDAASAAAKVARAKVANSTIADQRKPVNELSKDVKTEPPTPASPSNITVRGSTAFRVDSGSSRPAFGATIAPASGGVRGRVADGNNTPIAGALVTVTGAAGTSAGVSTTPSGEFTLGGLVAGTYRLDVRRIGFAPETSVVTIAAGQTSTANLVLHPASTALSEVVLTAQAAARKQAADTRDRGAAAPIETPSGAPITATQSNAVGCYELGITSATPSRTGFRQVPRRVALDSEIVPANAEGIWYRARDLARVGAQPNGLWRPSGPDALELEWTYGSSTARIRLAGTAGAMMRGSVEEIDRATATGEAGTVVAVRRACDK